jgi:hypothetical protein
MSQTDDPAARIIAQLAGEAELVDGGGFSLDPNEARRKLADRQLAERHTWILLVIEAAELLGVSAVEVRERVSGLTLELRGTVATELFEADELGELFTWVFVDLHRLALGPWRLARARQLLALAINAVLAGEVRSVALTRRTPTGSRQIVWTPAGRALVSERPGDPVAALELVVDQSLDAVASSAHGLAPRPELVAIGQRCGWGQVPLIVIGRELPRRPTPAVVRASAAIERDHLVIGEAELTATREGASLTIVSHGVQLETLELPGWALGFRAVWRRGYERDLSLGRAIRDPTFEAQVHATRLAHDQLVAQLHAIGQRVEFAGGQVAAVAPRPTNTLAAMVDDNASTLGHYSAWATLGFGFLAIAISGVATWVFAGAALLSALVAARSLRLRKVFGDEG